MDTGLQKKDRLYLFAPPASGLTMTHSFTFKLSLIHLNVLGSA